MNYTGRPSISGCRPVLSLYPTHRFCQYLLLIFITFTNSFLFNRAFSTNSRKPSQLKAPPLGEELNLSVSADALPLPGLNLSVSADALPPPLPRGGFGSPRKVNGFARGSPTRGAVERSETERLYEGKPGLCRKVRLLASTVSFWRNVWYNGFAALPAHFMGREVKPNGVYFHIYPVRRSECSVLLHLQVA